MNTQSTLPPSGKRNKTVAEAIANIAKPSKVCSMLRVENCVFEQEDCKIVVSENLLNALKQKEEDWDEAQRQKRNKTFADASIRFLGPSSMWAYSHHVMGMIREYVGQEISPEVPLSHDGVAFNIELPIKFHIVQTYHLCDEQKFIPAPPSLYSDGPPPVTAGNRMWYVQYFLIMALGKGLLTRGMSKAGSPGSEYFMKAMELFPDTHRLYIDPILSIEVCCGLTLYLEAVDPLNSAYVYCLLKTIYHFKELFLPFDLDHASSAGFVLALISAMQPFPDAAGESSFELTRNILDALIAGGNLPAQFRRQELERLHDMLHLIEQRDIMPRLQDKENGRISVLGEQGISPNQILNVASLLDGQTNLGVDLNDDVNGWLWEHTIWARMVEQRIICGWQASIVPTVWKDGHINGTKCVYWITFPQDEPQREKYLNMHLEAYPKETEELLDSSETLLGKPRVPTVAKFLPVGHVALDTHISNYAERLKLDFPKSGAYWVKSLYVSYTLQGLCIGGAAMNIAERVATEEPLNAEHLLLDTVHHEDQADEDFAVANYGGAFKVPTQACQSCQAFEIEGRDKWV
ncbi:hypothetical protein FAGAP_7717 [Fusarium agapanthi]|uniref:Uncharacterized protein n=1 Tax=Fusarium agapanthi TaxID=1803897 RepID=A0A9P5B715_9HYPO|nr:hypothetical protein FAGAP_7717 [Fusarium agapanthi]